MKLFNTKRKKNSSIKWLRRQLIDPFVIRSRDDGYRSRAAYKLIEINNKFSLLKPGLNLIDLGAAPGSWSQVAVKIIQSDMYDAKNKLIAIDLLPIEDIAGVTSFTIDFHTNDISSLVIAALDGCLSDVVLSDMAENTIGHKQTDHLRMLNLCNDALFFALTVLRPGGHFVTKMSRGGMEFEFIKLVRNSFKFVREFKPKASRRESREFYLVALNKKSCNSG
jgi:23S rRNA (uridine2552-2'-O)-methyltransferase